MIFYIAVFFGILAILATLLLVGLTCMGWLGMTGKVKEFINSFLTRQFDQQFRNHERVAINIQCYICIQRIKLPVVASCNHSYCAACIMRYIESKGGRQVECPACRQKICVLFRQFDPSNQQQRQLKLKISEYNFKNSQQPGIWRSITQLPNMIRNAPSFLSRDGVRFLLTNPRVKVILIMLIYTLSPIDFLPEGFLGPLGLFDDAFVSLNILREVSGLMISFAQEEQARIRGRQRQGQRQEERQRFAA